MSTKSTSKSIIHWGWTLSVFFFVTYLICIGFGLLAPGQFHMHEAWAPLMPGFEWLTVTGFLAGAAWSFVYGWYIAVLAVPLYRFFGRGANS